MSIIDDAITRLRYHALATKYDATNTFKVAPEYPPESGGLAKPFCITYINGGYMTQQDATTARIFANLACDFHFDITRFKTAYSQINTFIPDFLKRLAGDPQLNSSVSTISDNVTVEPPAQTTWGNVGGTELVTLMVRVIVPVKYMETPTS